VEIKEGDDGDLVDIEVRQYREGDLQAKKRGFTKRERKSTTRETCRTENLIRYKRGAWSRKRKGRGTGGFWSTGHNSDEGEDFPVRGKTL